MDTHGHHTCHTPFTGTHTRAYTHMHTAPWKPQKPLSGAILLLPHEAPPPRAPVLTNGGAEAKRRKAACSGPPRELVARLDQSSPLGWDQASEASSWGAGVRGGPFSAPPHLAPPESVSTPPAPTDYPCHGLSSLPMLWLGPQASVAGALWPAQWVHNVSMSQCPVSPGSRNVRWQPLAATPPSTGGSWAVTPSDGVRAPVHLPHLLSAGPGGQWAMCTSRGPRAHRDGQLWMLGA